MGPRHGDVLGLVLNFLFRSGKWPRWSFAPLPRTAGSAEAVVTIQCHHYLRQRDFFTLRAKLSGAVYCNRSCLWVCVFVGGCVRVCGSVTTITRNCVHRSSPNWVCKDSDHLQLIKFWPSRAPGKGSAAGRNFLTPPYYSQRPLFASL